MISNFLFHRVSPERDKLWDPMDVKLFEKCIKYISTKYSVELFEDLVSSGNISKRNKVATIMFDDGYKDNIEFAKPILDKYNVKASFYVVTDCIDRNLPTWTHVLEYSFQNTDVSDLLMDFNFLPKEFRITEIKTHSERINYVSKLKPYLKTISHEDRSKVLKRVTDTYKDVKLPKLMMNWDDLRQLKAEGHYIGSHTKYHNMLGTMSEKNDVREELHLSALRIEEMLGYFPLTISYPVGSFNDTTKKISKELGYKIGLAVKQNIYNPSAEDLFEVSRIELYNEPWLKTKLRITNTLEKIKSLIKYK